MVKEFAILSDSEEEQDDLVFGSDDEEIDEDAAFTAEDYLKYGDVGVKRKRGDPEEFSDDDGELTNITDLLNDSDDEDDEEIDPKQHKKLLSSITALNPNAPPRKKFKRLQSELYEESEYNLRPSAAKVEMEDLLPSLDDSKKYGDLKKKLEKLNDKRSPVDKPLSEPVKDRISRKAAYIKAKADISRWQTTVQRNRIIDQLQFPMNVPKVPFASNKTMTKEFSPSNDLESSIANVLEQGGINEKKISEFEQLAERQLTPEEVEQRRAELAKMRSLMLYKERKNKHQNKIKSRKFRKMLRLSKDKEKLSLEELAVVDPEKYQKLLETRELERIKERLTLKHSNTSKWAKRAIKQKDLNVRRAVHEQVQKGENLKRKMRNVHGSDSESDSDDSEDQMDVEDIYDNMQEEEKGLHALKFMKRAAEKQKTEFLDSLNPPVEDEDEVNGRRKYGPSTLEVKRQATEAKQKRVNESKKKKKSPLTNFKMKDSPKKDEEDTNTSDHQKNPWMNLKGGTKIVKKAKALENAQVSSNDSHVIATEIDVDAVISISEKKLEANSLLSKQKDIVEEAFAGLDVYKEFEEEKAAILNEPDNEPVAVQELPGWGSWAGDGVKMGRKQNYRLQKKKLQKEKEMKERAAKRKDAKLNNVIINEKVDTNFEKYQLKQLPFEYGNQRQYERILAQPIGPDWNTMSVHKSMTKPAVVTRPGLNIDPLEAPIKRKTKTSTPSASNPPRTRKQRRPAKF